MSRWCLPAVLSLATINNGRHDFTKHRTPNPLTTSDGGATNAVNKIRDATVRPPGPPFATMTGIGSILIPTTCTPTAAHHHDARLDSYRRSGFRGDQQTIPVDSLACAPARPGFVPPRPKDCNQDNNDTLETHVNSAPTFLHSVGSSAAPTTAGFAGDVLPCAPCFTQNGIAHSNDVLQNQYLMTCAILPPGFNPPLAIAKQHEKTHRDVLPLNAGNQHALDNRASHWWDIVPCKMSMSPR